LFVTKPLKRVTSSVADLKKFHQDLDSVLFAGIFSPEIFFAKLGHEEKVQWHGFLPLAAFIYTKKLKYCIVFFNTTIQICPKRSGSATLATRPTKLT
jgi:hypothetical protein